MNMHVLIHTPCRFAVGEAVDHQIGGMASIVIGRTVTAMGRELYAVREFASGKERHLLGSVLRPAAA